MSDFIEQIPHRIDTLEKAFPSTLSLPSTTPVVVLDTNVLLDWLYWGNEEVAQLKPLLASGWVQLRSRATMQEAAHVLAREGFCGESETVWTLLREWYGQSVGLTEDDYAKAREVGVSRCRDPDDQKFLDIAQFSQAQLLITRDKLVLKAGKRLKKEGTLVLTPQQAKVWLLSASTGA